MQVKARGIASLALAVGLAVTGFSGIAHASSSASARGAAQGISEDEIEVALLVPDVDGLIARGIPVSNLTNADFVRRLSGYVDAYGPINGRKIALNTVGWDPTDVTSFDKACIKATQDNKPFVVVNASGYQTGSIPCITVDNDTPFITGDMAYGVLQKGSGKNLVTVSLPSEVAAAAAVDAVVQAKAIPKTAKIGILSNNQPGVKAAGDTLESQLEKRGYDVVQKVELNGLAADVALLGREATTAVNTFLASGVDTVFSPQVFLSSFLGEMDRTKAPFKLFLIDGQSNVCTPISVSQVVAAANGATCITAWDSRSVPTMDALQPDSALEAKCRKEYDAATGVASTRGSSSGSTRTINGASYTGDFSAIECNIASFLLPAIKKAGKNPTWDKVHAALMASTDMPAAYLSDGKGGFGKNKPYFANPSMHFETLSWVSGDTAKDAKGLYNGCAIPAPCLIPQIVGGREWFTAKTGSNS